jgi:hypothetical protein
MNQLVTEARALSIAALNGPWVALCGKSAAAGEMMIRCTSLLPEMAAEIERLEAALEKVLHDLDQLKVANDKYLADFEAGRLVRLRDCNECRFKLESEAWKYYRYPCSECRQRVKDHFKEPLAAMEEDAHG